jgi:formylglycine-generating enzyme required for sulfatase activity
MKKIAETRTLFFFSRVLAFWLAGLVPLFCPRVEAAAVASWPGPPHELAPLAFPERRFSVREFGAVGDGRANDSLAFQQAIQSCHDAGGGTVWVAPGCYAIASVRLLSRVRLELDSEAEIIGASGGAFALPRPYADDVLQDVGMSYPELAILYGEDVEQVMITGGRINGGSVTRHDPEPNEGDKTIAFRNARGLRFETLRHETGGHFVYNLAGCEDVVLRDVVIGLPRGQSAVTPEGGMLLRNRDGISLVSCQRVRIFDCQITASGDDAIGIKNHFATGRSGSCSDIRVWNTHLETGCNALQLGSETAGDFRDIHFWDVTIGCAMKAALSVTSNDGGVAENISFRNIRVKGAATPIFLAVTDRLRVGNRTVSVGAVRNVRFSDITLSDFRPGWYGPPHPLTIAGHPDSPISDITFENMVITYPGGPPPADPQYEPAYTKRYSPDRIGRRSASAFQMRDARQIAFRNVRVAWNQADPRPAVVARRCSAVLLEQVQLQTQTDRRDLLLSLDAVSDLSVRDSNPLPDLESFSAPALPTPFVWRSPGETNAMPVPGTNFYLNLCERRFAVPMIWVAPGTFQQGSPASERGRDADERQHTVTLTSGFWLAAHEVSQRQWFALTGSNPSRFQTDPELPVHNVTWEQADEFCRRLTVAERSAGRLPPGFAYQLPTEAQWEYACRAGSTGASAGDLSELAWFDHNTGQRPIGGSPMPVGTKAPNPWGIHDLHGNVREWCLDAYAPYGSDAVTNPVGTGASNRRVIRGGGWRDGTYALRSANRAALAPGQALHDLGLRLCLAPDGPPVTPRGPEKTHNYRYR